MDVLFAVNLDELAEGNAILKIQFCHDWGHNLIVATQDNQGIRSEVDMGDFIKKLTAIVTEEMVTTDSSMKAKALAFSFTQETITGIINDIIKDATESGVRLAVNRIVDEMKYASRVAS